MLNQLRANSIFRVSFVRIAAPAGMLIALVLSQIALAAPTIELESIGAMSPRNQAAWWSPVVSHDGDLYLSYLAPNSPQDDVFVAKRSAGGEWEIRDTGVNAAYDVGHTQTSAAMDGAGYLHVFYGMHNHPIRYVTSNQPESISDGFTPYSSSVFSGFSGGAYTYPNLTTTPNGDVYLIIRDRRSSYSSQQGRLFRFNNDSRDWNELPPFAGQNGTTVYPDHIVADASGDLHILWEWAAGGAQGARHYGSYARFDPDTNDYYRADGTAYQSSPITVGSADIYQGLEGSETFQTNVHGVQSAKMVLDELGRPMVAYGYSIDGTASGYEHRFARWTGTEWVHNTVTPGPFDIDKSWLGYSNGVVRYYGTLSPTDPNHTGTDDIFLRTSTDYGGTWSDPIAVTTGLDIQRPVGTTVGDTDYLYLPSVSEQKLYFASVSNFQNPGGQREFSFQHGVLPNTSYEYQHVLIRSDTGYADTPQGDESLLVGTKAEPGNQGELRSILQFDLSSSASAIGSAAIQNVQLELSHLPSGLLPRIDGSPKIDLYTYASPFVEGASTWNDPDGDGNPATGDTTPGGTLGTFIGSLGELEAATATFEQVFASSPTFVAAVEDALAGDQLLRLILVEDQPDESTRDIAFFFGSDSTGTKTRLPKLTILTAFLPGDYNGDGTVNAADYAVWRDRLGSQTQLPNEDSSTTPGSVTLEDYEVWKAQFGASFEDDAFGATTRVAEPGGVYLSLFAAALILGSLQRRRRIRAT